MNKGIIYTLALLEGSAVMVAELCCNKLITPYFGTSVQVWAATLGVTLTMLAAGYLVGSYLSKDYNKSTKYLKLCFFIASISLILTSIFANWLASNLLNYSLEVGSTITLFFVLAPTLIPLGACSSLFINLLNENLKALSGKASGIIYFTSTFGGVISTFLVGFYLLPEFGVKETLIAFGILLGLGLLLIDGKRSVANKSLFLFLGIILVSTTVFAFERKVNSYFNIKYESDGLLGNIKVIEHKSDFLGKTDKIGRGLVVNNTLQTYMDITDPLHSSIWEWSNIIPTALSIYRDQKPNVLLCGLGGGTIVKQLRLLGYEFEVVELDKRLIEIDKKYFFLDGNVKITIDDARHFINVTDEKYDIIIFDTFLSESAPEQLLSKEALTLVKSKLKKGGMLLTNFYGFTSGDLGYAARSVIKTYMAAGFKVYPLATPGNEDGRNLLIIGTDEDKDFANVLYEETDGMKITDIRALIIPKELIDIEDAEVLSDNNPKLSKLYSEPSQMWKKGYNNIYTKRLYK